MLTFLLFTYACDEKLLWVFILWALSVQLCEWEERVRIDYRYSVGDHCSLKSKLIRLLDSLLCSVFNIFPIRKNIYWMSLLFWIKYTCVNVILSNISTLVKQIWTILCSKLSPSTNVISMSMSKVQCGDKRSSGEIVNCDRWFTPPLPFEKLRWLTHLHLGIWHTLLSTASYIELY